MDMLNEWLLRQKVQMNQHEMNQRLRLVGSELDKLEKKMVAPVRKRIVNKLFPKKH